MKPGELSPQLQSTLSCFLPNLDSLGHLRVGAGKKFFLEVEGLSYQGPSWERGVGTEGGALGPVLGVLNPVGVEFSLWN